MRKRTTLVLLLAAVVASMAFAAGAVDTAPPVYTPENPLVLFTASPGPLQGGVWSEQCIGPFVEKYKGSVVVRSLSLDISDGGTSAQNAYLAAGIRFLLMDYGGRVGELLVPEYALDLTPYMADQGYYEDQLALVRRDGKILGIPLPGQAQTMVVNQDVLDEVGFVMPEAWTTDDFLELCALTKAKRPDIVPFNWFCGERNADYYFMHVLSWFGVELYGDGYTKTTVNSPQGLAAFEFIKLLHDKGYMHADVASRMAAPFLQDLYMGVCATSSSFVGFMKNSIEGMVNQGKLEKAWNYQLVPFPRGPGVSAPKAFTMQWGIVVPRSDALVRGVRKPKDDFWDARYAELAFLIRDTKLRQELKACNTPTRKAEEGIYRGEDEPQLAKYLGFYGGAWDLGLFVRTYSAVRFLAFGEFQAMLNGTKTPAEALKSYAEEIDKILIENQ